MPDAVRSGPFTLDDLDRIAGDLLKAAGDCKVWAFAGELGSGKTTVIKAVCTRLGVRSPMTSPTFSIVNQYDSVGGRPVYHFDMYRLKNETEALDIGVEEYLDSGDYCLIEWPDRITSLLPPQYLDVHLTIDLPHTRKIEAVLHD